MRNIKVRCALFDGVRLPGDSGVDKFLGGASLAGSSLVSAPLGVDLNFQGASQVHQKFFLEKIKFLLDLLAHSLQVVQLLFICKHTLI